MGGSDEQSNAGSGRQASRGKGKPRGGRASPGKGSARSGGAWTFTREEPASPGSDREAAPLSSVQRLLRGESLESVMAAEGLDPAETLPRSEAWRQLRARSQAALLTDLRQLLSREQPGITITAATQESRGQVRLELTFSGEDLSPAGREAVRAYERQRRAAAAVGKQGTLHGEAEQQHEGERLKAGYRCSPPGRGERLLGRADGGLQSVKGVRHAPHCLRHALQPLQGLVHRGLQFPQFRSGFLRSEPAVPDAPLQGGIGLCQPLPPDAGDVLQENGGGLRQVRQRRGGGRRGLEGG